LAGGIQIEVNDPNAEGRNLNPTTSILQQTPNSVSVVLFPNESKIRTTDPKGLGPGFSFDHSKKIDKFREQGDQIAEGWGIAMDLETQKNSGMSEDIQGLWLESW
jgi:hypothetical protein